MRFIKISKKTREYLFYSIACIAGYIWIYLNVNKTFISKEEFTPCIFKSLTGVPCPSCGVTRSVEQIIHLNLYEALVTNPLGLVLSIALVIITALLLIDLFAQRTYLLKMNDWFNKITGKKPVLFTLLFLIAINWMWNIFKGL